MANKIRIPGVQQKGMINLELYTIQDLIDIILKRDERFTKTLRTADQVPRLLKCTYVELLLWSQQLTKNYEQQYFVKGTGSNCLCRKEKN